MMPTIQPLTNTDHDLLVQLHAKMDGLSEDMKVIKDLEYRVRTGEEKAARHSEKYNNLDTKLVNSVAEIKDDIKSLRNRDLFQSIALIMGTITAGAIAWFKH